LQKAKSFLQRKPSGACGCFVAGTLVWTTQGLVPIEQVRAGDVVLAKDEQSGELVFRLVTNEIVVKQTALLDVTLEQDGRGVALRTTDEHPFWVEGQGWRRADSLQPGQTVQTVGGTATVLALSFTGERTTVYNISVDGHPNYFVGPDGVWVHNCNLRWSPDRAAHVRLHNSDNLNKKVHGVFYDDGVLVTESAFARAQQQGLTPRPTGELDVPMGRIVGWEGGSQGTKAALDKVRIVINPQTFEVITAYPIK
jgi:hypothetical protein